MSLLNVESYVFINVFYLVLFYIHVCVDDVTKNKQKKNYRLICLLVYVFFTILSHIFIVLMIIITTNDSIIIFIDFFFFLITIKQILVSY